ncbi:MAG: multiheme c-type cytochrome [Desulfuromonadaceae bacterium]
MQMRRLIMTMFCLLPAAALMYGCGSSSKSGGTLSSVATVGDSACVQCHSAAKDPLTGEGIIDQYNKSAHALSADLNGTGCEACHGGGAQHNGVGPIAYPIPDATRCASCHTGTNSTVLQTGLAMAGAADDPTNPSNHANGGYEGVVTNEPCYRCHSGEGAVLSNVAGYTGNYGVSAAANADGVLSNNAYKLVQDRDFSKFKGIQCSTCHQHGGKLRAVNTRSSTGAVVAWDPNQNRKIDQFDLCTSCHNLLDNDGTTLIGSGTVADAATSRPKTNYFYHNTSWYRIIGSTHWDNPVTTGTQADANSDVTNTPIEGYVIRKTGENPCFDCHGHEAKTNTRPTTPARPSTVYTDWAKSAHAGHLLTVKIAGATGSGTTQVDNVMKAKTDDTTGIAWTHYNWDNSTQIARGAGDQDRKACQRCHTATGNANYQTNPATYDPLNNDFSHLSGWTKYNSRSNPVYTGQASPQNEVLYCWGCHSNAGKGTLRTPGAITANYGSGATANSYTYPDAKGSNGCIGCHSGLNNGQAIKLSTSNFSNVGFINSHYLTAGGTVFGNTGYHYTDRDYTIPAGDTHVKIGMGTTGNATVDATATNGPCAGCHFGSKDGSHSLKPVSTYSATDTSLNPLCVNCHSTRGEGTNAYVTWLGDDATAATFAGSTHKARYQAGLEALRALLEVKGYTFTANYPYFAATNWLSVGDVDTTGAITGKNNMGAAFNYNLMIHDPGGVAHNRRYTRRLIYDAIDWLDNNIMDYSVSATLTALPDPAYEAAAIAYLINTSGTAGTSGERH